MPSSTKMFAISGREFVQIVKRDLRKLNSGLGSYSVSKLGRHSGVSGRAISQLLAAKNPNPQALTIRLVLFTLGYQLADVKDDVIPHLKRKGAYKDELHGPGRKRKHLQ